MRTHAFSKSVLIFFAVIILGKWPQVWVSDGFADSDRHYKFKLRWQSVPGVTKYKIQIGRDRNFTKLVEEGETNDPIWTWEFGSEDLNSKGRVFYRVASVDQDGKVGAFSEPEILTLPSLSEIDNPVSENPPVKEEESYFAWRWSGAIHAGLGSFDQKSDASDLKRVTSNPFFQQKVSLFADLFQSTQIQAPERRWSLQFQFQYQPFYGSVYPLTYRQPNVSSYLLRTELLYWLKGNSPWHFAAGLVLDRSFRWFKTGALSVDSQGAFSIGPAAYFVWLAPHPQKFVPAEFGVLVGAPFSGVLTGGQFGVDLSLWSEWRVFRFSNSGIGVRFEGDGTYTSWSTPASTTVLSWSTWGAMIFHLGNEKTVF